MTIAAFDTHEYEQEIFIRANRSHAHELRFIEALKSGQVGSAGLDVHEEEEKYFFQDLSDQVLARAVCETKAG